MPRKPKMHGDTAAGRRNEAQERVRKLANDLAGPLKEANRQLGLVAEGGADPEMVSAATSLLRAITGAVAEKRKLEAHELRIQDEMSPEEEAILVMSYLRTCSREQRDVARRILAELEASEQVLGG